MRHTPTVLESRSSLPPGTAITSLRGHFPRQRMQSACRNCGTLKGQNPSDSPRLAKRLNRDRGSGTREADNSGRRIANVPNDKVRAEDGQPCRNGSKRKKGFPRTLASRKRSRHLWEGETVSLRTICQLIKGGWEALAHKRPQ